MDLLIGALAAILAGIVQSTLGFGLALVLAPLLLLILPPTTAVPIVVLMSLVNSTLASLHARNDIRPRLVFPLVLAGLVGYSAGVAVLLHANPVLLRLAVGIFVSVFSLALIAGWSKPLSESYPVLSFVGLLSGFAGGSTSIAGPPLALFLSNQQTPAPVFRANLLAFYFAVSFWGVLNHLHAGLLTGDVLLGAALYLPGTIIGTVAGILLSNRLPERLFQRSILLFVTATGVLLVIAAGCAMVMG